MTVAESKSKKVYHLGTGRRKTSVARVRMVEGKATAAFAHARDLISLERTLHFFVSLALVLFLLGHIGMICLAGFISRMRAMITGRAGTRLRVRV